MKTIEQAAIEYAANDKKRVTRSEHAAFAAGATFAQRWIPVAEELPPQNTPVLVKDSREEGAYKVLLLDDCFWTEKPDEGKAYLLPQKTTYWRPIELK